MAVNLLADVLCFIGDHPILSAFISAFVLFCSGSIVFLCKHFFFKTQTKKIRPPFAKQVLQGISKRTLHPIPIIDDPVAKYCYWVEVDIDSLEQGQSRRDTGWSMAVFSGKRALVSKHSIHGSSTVSVFKTWKGLSERRTMIDHCPYTVVYESKESDLCVIELAMASNLLFPLAREIFHEPMETAGRARVKDATLITPDGVLTYPADSMQVNEEAISIYCDSYKRDIIVKENSGVYTKYGYKGMCGSPLITRERGFIGCHIAGSEKFDPEMDYNGFVYLNSEIELAAIRAAMIYKSNDDYLVLEDVAGSAMRVRYNKGEIIPHKPIKSSKLYETSAPFLGSEVCKEKGVPIMVDDQGTSLLKELVKPNLGNTGSVPEVVLNFADKAIKQHLTTFGVISWEEVIKGTDVLAPLKKDSVNGYGYDHDKEHYIDFENGKIDPDYLIKLNLLEDKLEKGELDLTEMLAYHQLKDEPRPKGKKPRTFAIMPLHMTLLFKKYFGALMSYVIVNRHSNGIAIGVNPYKEWTQIYNNLTADGKKVMDADFGRWDRSLIGPFLDRVLACMILFFKGTDREKKIIKNLAWSLTRMFILVNDEVYLITHGLQSGCWLTALLNSFVNKYISACSFYSTYGKYHKDPRLTDDDKLNDFNRIIEYFMGDDRISGVPKDLENSYNLETLKPFVEGLGMEITDGRKRPIQHRFVKPTEMSFLKRTFVVNTIDPSLPPVLAPLSLDTLGNLFKFCNSDKDFKIVMTDRSVVYQIERALHGPSTLLDDFENQVKLWFKDNHLTWRTMPRERIVEILQSDNGYDLISKKQGKFYTY